MEQAGKSSTTKRGRTSYTMSIIGVSLVLMLLGAIGWLGINYTSLLQYYKENKISVQVYLRETTSEADKDALINDLKTKPYVKKYSYIDKETAKKIWSDLGNKDFMPVLDTNILPRSVEFNLKSEYVDTDSLSKISAYFSENSIVTDVQYPKGLVGDLKLFRKIGLFLAGIAIFFLIAVIILIDNTTKLAMFSNRFLIKTMQMVGATRWFIAKPFDLRAIINGTISAVIAIIVGFLTLSWLKSVIPDLEAISNSTLTILLAVLLLIIGVAISLVSTHRSVIKYLKMKLDDLY
ncbi:cell division protein FtsX [Polluticaenibacter yanchengensis]|uniref:Cell division protein FtsX n=1 Tax=Polluticaenibacter yanchengensis TaxID=3014562 RepID=A0ABT4UNN6_9BACT|nr:permease-like cell division protein FtsX [Chitinophagaceae bacterium LY-5]